MRHVEIRRVPVNEKRPAAIDGIERETRGIVARFGREQMPQRATHRAKKRAIRVAQKTRGARAFIRVHHGVGGAVERHRKIDMSSHTRTSPGA